MMLPGSRKYILPLDYKHEIFILSFVKNIDFTVSFWKKGKRQIMMRMS